MAGRLRWILSSTAVVVVASLAALAVMTPAGSAATPAASAPASVIGKRLASFHVPDSAGKVRTLDEFQDRKALVLVFLSTGCPVANSYTSPLSALQQRYQARGVQVLGINANPDETPAEIAKHASEYHLGFPVLKDEKQVLADRLGARVTPEAFVVDSQRIVRYRGRIDDGFATRTKRSSEVRSRDLEAAIEAVLGGGPVLKPVTEAVGCAIVRPKKATATAKVTYHKNVEPILQARCQTCHRPGQVAPFSLLTYRDARNWAQEIKEFTGTRQMPPWLAEPGHGEFQDVRRLSDEEIRTLVSWADAGAPEGSVKDAPPARAWSDEWMLGKPDLVLTPSEEYEVAATGDDVFQVFVLPTNLTEDKQVAAIDFRPGNPRVVHHVVSFVDTTGRGRKLDAEDPAPGYTSGPGGIKVPGAALQGVWAPGNLPRFLPSGVGRPVPKGSDILIQMHYHKTGKPETDRTQVALYFTKEPVKQVARTTIVGPFAIDIPAGATRNEVKASMVLPIGFKVLTIMPHMHLLGKELKVTATLPDGTVKEMVWVRDWDYRWQDSYRYKEPLELPKNTKIELIAYHDNSSGNPRNPSSPPRRVTFGEQTTDEMAFAIMEVVLDLPAPEAEAQK